MRNTLLQDLQNPRLRELVTRSVLAAIQAPSPVTPCLYSRLDEAFEDELRDALERHDAVLELVHECALIGAHWPDTVGVTPVPIKGCRLTGWTVQVADQTLHLFRYPDQQGGFGVWNVTPQAGPRLPLSMRHAAFWAQSRSR